MTVTIHWSAFDDMEWACGGKWPEPISRRPLVCGPDHPQCSPDPKRATCPGCQAFVVRLYGLSPELPARAPSLEPASSARCP